MAHLSIEFDAVVEANICISEMSKYSDSIPQSMIHVYHVYSKDILRKKGHMVESGFTLYTTCKLRYPLNRGDLKGPQCRPQSLVRVRGFGHGQVNLQL